MTSPDRYRILFDFAPICLYEIDVEGRILAMNAAGLKLIGAHSLHDVQGHLYSEFVGPADQARVQHMLTSAFQGRPSEIEFVCANTAKQQRLTTCFIPCVDADGEISNVMGISYGNGARASLESHSARDELQTILDNVPAYIFYKDTHNNIIHTNKVAADSLGLIPEDMAGKPTRLFYPEHAERYYRDDLEVIHSGKPKLGIVEPLRVSEDKIRWIETSKIPIRDRGGRVTGILVLASDITERKHAEEVMQKAKEAAERANTAKTTFLAAASHDLRQPLQTISFLTSALSKTISDRHARRYIDALESAVDTTRELLSTLLDVSRLDSGGLEPEVRAFRVAGVLDKIKVQFQPNAAEKGVHIRVAPCSATVVSDPVLLEQIVRNFVDNAIRYTPSGKVLVGCRHQSDRLTIQVWDTGIGISPDQLNKMFEDFYQINNPARERSKGLGLGLGIAQRMACLLGHDIGVRSWPGRGSRFSVAVPLNDAQKPLLVTGERGPNAARTEGKTILLVENDPAVQEAARLLLEVCGFRVIAVECGVDAVRRLATCGSQPELIIADYRLPQGETGTEVIERIRDALGLRIPAILVTGDTSLLPQDDLKRVDYRFLHKPVDSEQLLELIDQLLGTSKHDAI